MLEVDVTDSRFRIPGAGRKVLDPNGIRSELFTYFNDIRESLRGRLPRSIFILSRAKELYLNYQRDCATKGHVTVFS